MMILREIYLKNFRSYKEATVSFTKGSTLLSGDIGSGKSSILLAAEFALFGIMRGIFSGETLLRSGKTECTVRLTFQIKDRTYIIQRGLKKKGEVIQQTPGFLATGGDKKELMPEDLKAAVLDILGYPKDLLKSSKGFVYRYTVYTPQEEMKQIITEKVEDRLNILRKVFGIERYKLMVSNASIVTRGIRESVREMEGKTDDLEPKKLSFQEQDKELKAVEKEAADLVPEHTKSKETYLAIRKGLEELEKEYENLQRLRIQEKQLEEELKSKVEERSRNIKDLEELKTKRGTDKIPDPINTNTLNETIKRVKETLHQLDKQRLEGEKNIGSLEGLRNQAEDIKKKVKSIDNCPTCEQKVSPEHKQRISVREEMKQKDLAQQILKIKQESQQAILSKKEKEEELQTLQRKVAEVKVHDQHRKTIIELDQRITTLTKRNTEIKGRIGEINQKKIAIRNTIEMLKGKESELKEKKKEVESAREAFHDLDKRLSVKQQEAKGKKSILDMLKKEIEAKELVKKRLIKAKETLSWVDQKFVPMIQNMERSVMRAVYHEFNALFTQWFNILIEDETLSVRLDEEFSPVVIQNGYEIDVHSLSGGEKTSCALAYRLALNKVINDIIDTIKTKDLIILDEPTDGFSNEQLDRMRDLLQQIGMSQVIIVSHESKIESFVENVIRVDKQHHTSKVY
jgi:exonuclease SbcC